MTSTKYVPVEERASDLIEAGVQAWQNLQRYCMGADDQIDSVVLLGQRVWLPHHETDPTRFSTTLELIVHPAPGADPEVVGGVLKTLVAAGDTHGRVELNLTFA